LLTAQLYNINKAADHKLNAKSIFAEDNIEIENFSPSPFFFFGGA